MATQKEIAKHIDVSERHIRRMLKDGILPPSKPGGYNLEACRIAYIRYLRGVSSGQIKQAMGPVDTEEDGDYTLLLEKEKYREKKRQNDLEEQLVAPVSSLTEALEKTAAQVIPIMDALPLEMKRRNPKLTGHDIQLVKK